MLWTLAFSLPISGEIHFHYSYAGIMYPLVPWIELFFLEEATSSTMSLRQSICIYGRYCFWQMSNICLFKWLPWGFTWMKFSMMYNFMNKMRLFHVYSKTTHDENWNTHIYILTFITIRCSIPVKNVQLIIVKEQTTCIVHLYNCSLEWKSTWIILLSFVSLSPQPYRVLVRFTKRL